MTLRARMGLAAGLAVALAVLAVAVSAYAGTRSQLRGQVDQALGRLTRGVLHPPPGAPQEHQDEHDGSPGSGPQNGLAPRLGAGLKPEDRDEGLGLDQRERPAFGGAAGTLALIYPSGKSYSPPGQSGRIPIDSAMRRLAATGRGRYFTDAEAADTHLRVLVTGVGRDGALAVALPLSDVDRTLSHELLLLVLIAAGGIALAALLGIFVARTALAPIGRFTRQTEAIALEPDRIEHERLGVHGKDELARLALAFNRTLDALERSVESQRNLVADASHELRTPIASLRANLQLLHDEELLAAPEREALRRDMIEELDELTALVGDVVELARGSKVEEALGEVRLDEIVAQAVARTERRAPELTVRAQLEPTLVRGEGDRIARAVANLLENAMKWSPRNGTIEIDLAGGTLRVRDHGPGFQPEDLPFVFDRFHRAKTARGKPGSGLGLAIVRQAAEAHGGFARAGNAPGGGAALEVSFGSPLPMAETAPESLSAS